MPRISKEARNALERLEAAEARAAEAAQKASEAATNERTARAEVDALITQRNHLADRDPNLITHTGAPNPEIEGNPLFAIDEALKGIDLEDLTLRTAHARKLEERERAEVEAVIWGNYPAIEGALLPQVEAAQELARDKIGEALESVEVLIGWNHRFTNLAANAPGIDGRAVRGIEHLAALRKSLTNAALPSPIPVKPDGWNPPRRSS
jgi:hypothetical protein